MLHPPPTILILFRSLCIPCLSLPPPPSPPLQSFFLHPPVECAEGDKLPCDIEVARRNDNQRLMDVMIRHRIEGRSKDRVSCFHIE